MKDTLFLIAFCMLFSCSKEEDTGINVNVDSFTKIENPYPYTSVNPGVEVDYWALINAIEVNEQQTLFESGIRCSNTSDSVRCVEKFNALQNQDEGFAPGCYPAYCNKFIKYHNDTIPYLVTTKAGVQEFLGEIDSHSDAILLAYASGYEFYTEDKDVSAYKAVEDGYELLMQKLINDCDPIQTNRYHLKVSTSGEIEILKEEVWSKMEGACI